MNTAGSSQGNDRSSDHHGGPHSQLSPHEAAMRGAAMAFSKQQQQRPQQQQTKEQQKPQSLNGLVQRQSLTHHPKPQAHTVHRDDAALEAAAAAAAGHPVAGSGNERLSRQTTGSSNAQERRGGGGGGGGGSNTGGEESEREKEKEKARLALFLSSPGTKQDRSMYLSTATSAAAAAAAAAEGNGGDGRAAASSATASASRSASFLAANLAASRSVSPSPVSHSGDGGGGGGGDDARIAARGSLQGQPAHIRREGSIRTDSPGPGSSTTSSDDLPDTSSLAPTTSLISMFEDRGGGDVEPIQSRQDHPAEAKARPPPPKPRKSSGEATAKEHVAVADSQLGRRQSSGQKPPAPPARDPAASVKARPEVPKNHIEPPKILPRRSIEPSERLPRTTTGSPNRIPRKSIGSPARSSSKSVHSRERSPRESIEVTAKLPPEVKRLGPRRRSLDASTGTDGHDSSKPSSPIDTGNARPSSAGSDSSKDSFVSASSTPDRVKSPPVNEPAPRSLAPSVMPSRPKQTQPPNPSQPIRRTGTGGSSQLTLDSLTNAIVASSLASARHTPVPSHGTNTPPPLPPARRNGGKPIPSPPRRMKLTLREPRASSDDEEARKPHHRKKLINNKKHTHHEGSRHRWRDEITEREKKRYEAVWASNRGIFLVQPTKTSSDARHGGASRGPSGEFVRDEAYEQLSEHVSNVVVRDIWSRSRLPDAELAEVWDLVYRRTGRVFAALNRPEFVVGMWLIDQRLRGRKIPTAVSDSVWDSAKGLRVWTPGHGHGHGVHVPGVGHGHGHSRVR